jgi:hypothetical protein
MQFGQSAVLHDSANPLPQFPEDEGDDEGSLPDVAFSPTGRQLYQRGKSGGRFEAPLVRT